MKQLSKKAAGTFYNAKAPFAERRIIKMNYQRRGPSSTYYFAAFVFLLSAITNFYKHKISTGIIFLVITVAYVALILVMRKHYEKHNGDGKQ